MSARVKVADKNHMNFGDTVTHTSERLAAYLTSMLSYTMLLGSLKKAYGEIIALDTAISQLAVVTGLSVASLEQAFSRSADSAIRLGTSVKDMLNSVAEWGRLGYGLEEAQALAEASTVLSNVGSTTVEQATTGLVSIVRAFKIEAKDALEIVDKLVTADVKFPIDTEGAMDAMQRSSSALQAANNTFEESLALATAMNSILQSPEKVGTSLTTIAARIRSTSGALKEMGEDSEGAFDSVTKLQQSVYELTNNKVNIMVDSETFKSTYDIIKEIAAEWENLTDIQQAQITQLFGGTRQSQAVSALIQSFSVAEEAVEAFGKSSGTALQKNEVIMDTVAKKAEIFGAQFSKTAHDIMESGLVKRLYDVGQLVLQFLDLGGGNVGKIVLLTAAVAALTTAMRAKEFAGIIKNIKAFGSQVLSVINPLKFVVQVVYAKVTANKALEASAKAAAAAEGSMTVGVSLLIAALVTAGFAALQHFTQAQQKAIDKANELTETYKQQTATIKQNISTVEGFEDEFNRLSRGVDDSGVTFAPPVWKHAGRTDLKPVTRKAA